MKKKNSELNDREAHLIEQLRERPELMERFEAILGLTECENGPVRRADDVEDMLVEEVRRLGITAPLALQICVPTPLLITPSPHSHALP